MVDQKLLNRAITISAKEEKLQAGKPVVKLKDEKGLTYTVYKLKQDGTESIAWGQLSELDLGDTVQIGYVEDIVESAEFGKVTYRTIRSFNKDIGNGMANHQAQTQTPRGGANNASGRGSDAFGRRLAIHGMVNGLLASSMPPEMIIKELPNLLKLEDAIDSALSPVSEPKPVSEPTIHADEDLNVEGIPF